MSEKKKSVFKLEWIKPYEKRFKLVRTIAPEVELVRRKKISDYLNKKYSLMGKRFGRLLVCDEFVQDRRRVCVCQCDCGGIHTTRARNLLVGKTKSCGCLRQEIQDKSDKRYKERLFMVYQAMRHRCYNPSDTRYKNYGGRGIKICPEWLEDYKIFKKWALAHGYGPKLSIERMDVNGDYCPENCRWITLSQQQRNKTNNRRIEYGGENKTLIEWCELFNLSYKAVHARLNNGWGVEKALETPTPTGFKGGNNGKKSLVGRPTVMTDETIDKLQESWAMGCSDLEACCYANISSAALYNYQKAHPEFVERKAVLKERMVLKAREVVHKALQEGDKDMAKWYLERKKKDEFSTKVENSGNPAVILQVASPDAIHKAQDHITRIIEGELAPEAIESNE